MDLFISGVRAEQCISALWSCKAIMSLHGGVARASRTGGGGGGRTSKLNTLHISAGPVRACAAAAVRPAGLVLGIESSCDDTGVAVMTPEGHILGQARTRPPPPTSPPPQRRLVQRVYLIGPSLRGTLVWSRGTLPRATGKARWRPLYRAGEGNRS